MPSVSLIVPIYNSEHYLIECLHSIRDQQFTDFECLLIDDGSTDGSSQICMDVCKKDCRFKYFPRPHFGVSNARSFALTQALGEYICWTDSDDIITPFYIQDLYDDIKTTKCDLVIHGYIDQRDGGDEKKTPISHSRLFFMPEQYEPLFQEVDICRIGHSFSKLFRRSIIQEDNTSYYTQMIVAEDLDFLIRYIPHCCSIYVCNKANYIYRSNPQSISNRIYSYRQEMSGLMQLSSSWQNLASSMNLRCESFERQSNLSIAEYVHRVVCSCYQGKAISAERIKNLQNIPDYLVKVYGINYRPTLFISCVSWLVYNGYYRLADFLLSNVL